MSSGRTFQVTTAGKNQQTPLAQLTPDIGAGELIPDRWAVNVINLSTSAPVLVGRQGGALISLPPGSSSTPGGSFRFEGCSYRDIVVNDQGTSLTIAVDGSDTLEERGKALGLR